MTIELAVLISVVATIVGAFLGIIEFVRHSRKGHLDGLVIKLCM